LFGSEWLRREVPVDKETSVLPSRFSRHNAAEPLVSIGRSRSKSPFLVLRRGPLVRRLRIRITCSAYHRPPLGDGTFRALSSAATAAAGSVASCSRIGRNRSARSVAAARNLRVLSICTPPRAHQAIRGRVSLYSLTSSPVENEDQSSPRRFAKVKIARRRLRAAAGQIGPMRKPSTHGA
jgi:hypothetical protein